MLSCTALACDNHIASRDDASDHVTHPFAISVLPFSELMPNSLVLHQLLHDIYAFRCICNLKEYLKLPAMPKVLQKCNPIQCAGSHRPPSESSSLQCLQRLIHMRLWIELVVVYCFNCAIFADDVCLPPFKQAKKVLGHPCRAAKDVQSTQINALPGPTSACQQVIRTLAGGAGSYLQP